MRLIGRFGLLMVTLVATLAALPHHATQAAPTSLLTAADFKLVAQPGFGETALGFHKNTWAWSGAFFNNRVYIGAAPFVACGNIVSGPPQPPGAQPPCPPSSAIPPNQAAEIWSVNPSVTHPLTQADWVKNYTSPLSVPINGEQGPLNSAFRGMSVYTDPRSSQQTLFASGMGYGIPGFPPSLMGTTDGTTFTDIPQAPGTTMGDIPSITTTCDHHNLGMRASAQLGGTFYVAITGGGGGGSLFASPTPWLGNNTFQQITSPTLCVWDIMAFNGHLYIGTASPQGYGVVRTDCSANCSPGDFIQVIPPGAGIPGNLNNDVESMGLYTDPGGVQHLYVGAGVTPLTVTTAAELTRINPDNSWDLIVGTPRTVKGVVKTPLSRFGEGFNFHQNKYIWRMVEYNGALYVGTYSIATSAYINTPGWNKYKGIIGCNLWASADGVTFTAVTRNGFGDPYCEGIRSMVSTRNGLFLGGVNDWNGFEVWEGVPPNTPPTPTPTVTSTVGPTATPTPPPAAPAVYLPLIRR